MDSFFVASLEANREIYDHLSGGLADSDRLKSTIGAGGDISSGIDLIAEDIFVKHLAPFGRIESEESGIIGDGEQTIIVDPIDGSSNILSGFPYFGTSVALVDKTGKTIKGVICNLATGEIFFKSIGEEATCGRLSDENFIPLPSIEEPEIGIFERAYAHQRVVEKLGLSGMKFRAPGAVALSLVYARHSRFFLYVGGYRSYDFAAGLLFCEDMEVIINDQYVIVSSDKNISTRIENLVIEAGE